MEPTTAPVGCAAVEAATQKSIRAAASNFMVHADICIFLRREDNVVGPILRFVRKAGADRRFPRVVLTGLLVLGAAANAAAQPVQKQVLVLQSFDRGNIVVDNFTTNFHVELDQRAEQPVNFVQVVVGPIGPVGAPERAIVDFIVSTFADGPKPDLIVAMSGPASIFARKYRRQLFPDTPLLFAAVDERYLRAAPLGENETAVASANDFPRLIDDILQVLPQTRQVFVVAGTGQLGEFWRRELEEPFSRFRDRLTFEWLDKSVPFGDAAPLCQPAGPLGDLLSHVRHRRGRSGVRGRASARRPPRHGQCSSVWRAERAPRRWRCRRNDDVH